ncbi:Squalene/phytoene synthase-domain-containing protein [Multifurca ochricompacta]|uniref:Squalene/phytoene synthase-domain-containing protein n=1 Tax=Multifurca ochricompacta TaxID=376703 RepID=A0AAD4QNS9_9AGAM|nr:Squalene/phytoene synthase-domain-containing protein [Multifurca ochricompacta]
MESLTAHAESTASTHYYLLLSLLGISSDTLSHAASHLGVAHCISTLLRALPYHASKSRVVIPAEITAKHGVSQEDVFRKRSSAHGIDDAVFEFATIANDHIITAREMFRDSAGRVPRVAIPVFSAWKDEVLQIIFNEIDHPSSFVVTCRRFNVFSRDPYVRAHYFLSRYGSIEALYWALGRGKLTTEQVLDVLLSSGAHLSRYLVQIAMHHYFRSSCPFIKTPWVRTLSLSTFSHFLKLSSERFETINQIKGEDDGTVFRHFIKESRLRSDRRGLATDAIAEMLDKGKFIPFCSKDPIMAQFPLALSIEPRLLPLAIANGFRMDSRYRDFVFRRIFERSEEHRAKDVLLNVRELCRLDTSMFVSRTVAAEVLMEAETNDTSYAVLKVLDREGDLRFSLASLVENLIKLFIKTRSITTPSAGASLRFLWKDFPSSNPTARLVMLLTVFIGNSTASVVTLHSELERLHLTPVSTEDIAHVLLSPFVEYFSPILRYARAHCRIDDDTMFSSFLADVAVRCLEVASKGNMLRCMCEEYPSLKEDIQLAATTEYQLTMDDLPPPEREKECAAFESKLCRDPYIFKNETVLGNPEFHEDEWDGDGVPSRGGDTAMRSCEGVFPSSSPSSSELFLGEIGQETLTQVITHDELDPRRKRTTPWPSHRINWSLTLPYLAGRLNCWPDLLPVGRWIRNQFGRRHPVTATFMNHAVVNEDHVVREKSLSQELTISLRFQVLQHYLLGPLIVPVTLQHFKMLARLGRAPNYLLFRAIQDGAEFFFSDSDYLKHSDVEVKRETPGAESVSTGTTQDSPLSIDLLSNTSATSNVARTRKRLHRSAAATVKSYALPDSDDESPIHGIPEVPRRRTGTRAVDSNLQLWIKHLSTLKRDENKKFKEKKRHIEQSNLPVVKIRAITSDFLRALTAALRELRQLDSAKKQQAHVPAVPDEYSESDYDEYQCRKRPSKLRKTSS